MTKVKLPEAFLQQRLPLFGEEGKAFLASYEQPKSYGLRLNPLKKDAFGPLSGDAFLSEVFHTSPEKIPWTREGYYLPPEVLPGRHPLHEAGAYYIQEPSAMAVVSLLDPKPGETICDLCAAPGGKSTQIAGRLQGTGLLITNEIIPGRAKILSGNIERLGIANAIVCNETPDHMAELFPSLFDRVLVDAPCSGEGMFRKDETAILEWSPENVSVCAKRQQDILQQADLLLKPGGTLVYSTCTFSLEENEQLILWFLDTHPDYELVPWRHTTLGELVADKKDFAGLTNGYPIAGSTFDLTGTLRLLPHRVKGEGHFAARLQKRGQSILHQNASAPKTTPLKKQKHRKTKKSVSKNTSSYQEFLELFYAFAKASFVKPADTFAGLSTFDRLESRLLCYGDQYYLLPELAPDLNGCKVLRPGLQLGTLKKNRIEPAHALAKYLKCSDALWIRNCDEAEAGQYLKGETLSCDSNLKGWTLVCHRSFPLGWGKAQNGVLKNHFPKGLRHY